MKYQCGRCHHGFAADEDPRTCPNCAAEAGLEAVGAVPPAMWAFAFLLGAVILGVTGLGVVVRMVGA